MIGAFLVRAPRGTSLRNVLFLNAVPTNRLDFTHIVVCFLMEMRFQASVYAVCELIIISLNV